MGIGHPSLTPDPLDLRGSLVYSESRESAAEAEVDWEHGSARIPEEWPFTVGSNDIDIRARNGVRVHPVSDSYGSMKSMLLPTRNLTRLQGQSTDHTSDLHGSRERGGAAQQRSAAGDADSSVHCPIQTVG